MKKNMLFVLIFLMSYICIGQKYDELVERKNSLANQVELLNQSIKKIQSNKKNSLEELAIIDEKIILQEDLLELLEEEITKVGLEEQKLESELEATQLELELVKKNYTQLIQLTYKSTQNYNRLLFFLASRNFNQLMRRISHMRKIAINRKKKYNDFQALQQELVDKRLLVLEKKSDQAQLIFQQKEDVLKLKDSRETKETMLKELNKKSDSLKVVLKKRNIERKNIESEILSIVKSQKSSIKGLTPELKLISNKFESNKGRLPWPVSRGFLVGKFGQTPHPVLSGIKVMNNGVEISTNEKNVRSVFDGEVTKIIVLPNGLKVVIIRHGEYLTVYSNLKNVSVQKGDHVQTKDDIGNLYAENNNKNNLLGFQIWKDRIKLNPMHWISNY